MSDTVQDEAIRYTINGGKAQDKWTRDVSSREQTDRVPSEDPDISIDEMMEVVERDYPELFRYMMDAPSGCDGEPQSFGELAALGLVPAWFSRLSESEAALQAVYDEYELLQSFIAVEPKPQVDSVEWSEFPCRYFQIGQRNAGLNCQFSHTSRQRSNA